MKKIKLGCRASWFSSRLLLSPNIVVSRRYVQSCETTSKNTIPSLSVLPGLEVGMKVAQPTPQYPAGVAEEVPLSDKDSRVEWVEHYCSEKQAPYYHNLKTDEVTFEVPEGGFVTRFPQLYTRLGYHIDGNGAVQRRHVPSRETDEADGPLIDIAKMSPNLSPREKLAAYGTAGVLWYLIIHFFFWLCLFFSIYIFHFDLLSLARSYGFYVPVSTSSAATEDVRRPSFWRSFVTAVVLNKLLFPIQVALTLATVPKVIVFLRPISAKVVPHLRYFFKMQKKKIHDRKVKK